MVAWTWRSGATLDWVPWYPGEPNGTGTVASFYNINGGPRLTLDDTFESDARRGLIVEFPAVDATCPGDVNQDNQVDFADLILILANWGTRATVARPTLTGTTSLDSQMSWRC